MGDDFEKVTVYRDRFEMDVPRKLVPFINKLWSSISTVPSEYKEATVIEMYDTKFFGVDIDVYYKRRNNED